MAEFITPTNILFIIAIITFVSKIVFDVKNPQNKSELNDALFTQALETLRKDMELNFTKMEKTISNLKDNHLHTLDTKIEANKNYINDLSRSVTKLATIIDERIPRK